MAKASDVLLPPAPLGHIAYEDEMQKSYIDYAMSVIVSRALPDIRDGAKPVHRRILYGAYDGGYTSTKPYRKSARIVGDVMGKFHPHGDSAIYDALVRLAQPFSMSNTLIDGQGNFGSPDGDKPAAMRYTEARMSRLAEEGLVADLDEDTVDFRPTYDQVGREPVVLPARFPNILVNGGEGIAVGMATKMPPHNLGEVIDAVVATLDDPEIDIDGLMRIMPGPDFPTGAIIKGTFGVREAYEKGNGSIVMMSVHHIEIAKNGRETIVITELPYQVNKAALLEKLAELVNAKTIEGISGLRDESAETVRVIVELKKDANSELVLTKMRKETNFMLRFSINNTCLNSRGQPQVMGLRDILLEFIAFRKETIARRTRFRLDKARTKLTTQIGLFAARGNVDEVVRVIRAARDSEHARMALMEMQFSTAGELSSLLREADPDAEEAPIFQLSEEQARSVLALRLSHLTSLEQEKIASEARSLMAAIRSLLEILGNPEILEALMRAELAEIRAKFAIPRRTSIQNEAAQDIEEDDLYDDKPVVLTLTRQGYIKITDVGAFREQSRGGKGRSGMETKDDDYVVSNLVCSLRTSLIFFSTRGIAHIIKAYKLPNVAPNARGKPIVNFIKLREGEAIATVMAMPSELDAEGRFMMFVTSDGDVRRNAISDFQSVNVNGKIAMKLEDDNGHQTARLIAVLECGEDDDVVIATRRGKAVRFPVTDVRVFKGRASTGIKGVSLQAEDQVIGASIVKHLDLSSQERDAYFDEGKTSWEETPENGGEKHELVLTPQRMDEIKAAEQTLLAVTSRGYGKRCSTHDFRTTGRGAQGVWAGVFGAANGDLVVLAPVDTADGVMMVTGDGQSIRTRASEIKVMGRSARGVRVFDLKDNQTIVDVARIPADD